MPATKIRSTWSSGELYFYEESVGRSTTGDLLKIGTSQITIGNSAQDVDLVIYLGAADQYVKFDAGAATATFAKTDVTINGDLTIDTEDLNLGDNDDLEFGDGQDTIMRWSTADASNHSFVIGLDNTNQGMHITDKAAVATDWNIAATTHPCVYIHSNTTPATDYLLVGNHDGTTAHVDVVGGTTLSLDIAGTPEVTITASATSPATTDSNALGTTALMWSDLFLASGGVINFNNGNVTITHSAGALAIAGAAITINDAGADLDFRVESDNLAYALYVDGGKDCIVIGDNTDISDVDNRLIVGNVAKILTAGESASIMAVTATASTTEAASGTHTYISSAYFSEPNITHNAGGTITTAATVYIADAPTEGNTNNAALYIASGSLQTAGAVYIDSGTLAVGKDATAGTIELYPSTTNQGKTTITMTDNTGDTITNINVAAQGGARIYTIPDSGDTASSFLMTDSTTMWWPFAIGLAGEDTDGLATNSGGIAGGTAEITTNMYTDGGGTVFCRVYDAGTTTYEDLKDSSSLTHWTANYQLLPDAASEASADACLIGMANEFCEIVFDDFTTGSAALATWGGDGGRWMYSTGAGTWSVLTVFDNTDATAQDGKRPFQRVGCISFAPPSDWAKATYDTQEAYWVKFEITAAQLTQTPLIDTTNKDEPKVAIPNADTFDTPFKCSITRLRVTDFSATIHDQNIKFVFGNFTDGVFANELTWTASQLNDTFTLSSAIAADPGDRLGICVTDDTASTNNPVWMMEMELSLED